MSLPAVRFRTAIDAGSSEKYYPQMLHLTQVKMSTCKDRDGNVYISLMRQNGLRRVEMQGWPIVAMSRIRATGKVKTHKKVILRDKKWLQKSPIYM